jgi:hypothetical protein
VHQFAKHADNNNNNNNNLYLGVCVCVRFIEVNLYRVEQRKRMFFKWLVHGKGGVDDDACELADSSDGAVSVAVEHWNVCLPSSNFFF